MVNWDVLKVEWETTDISLADLAAKHGVKLGTLKSRKSREKWLKGAIQKDATGNQEDATISKVDATTGDNNSWLEIETVYITDIRKKPCTLKDLAEKYGITHKRVREYAAENQWTEKRDKYRTNIGQKTTKKIAERTIDDLTNATERHFDISNKLLDILEEAVNTPGEFNKVVEKVRVGEFGEEEVQVIEIDALAEKRIATVISSIANIQKMQRQTLDVMNAREEAALNKTNEEKIRIQKLNEAGNQQNTEQKLEEYFTALQGAFTNEPTNE